MRFVRIITRDRGPCLGVRRGNAYVDLTSAEKQRSGRSLESITDLMMHSEPLAYAIDLIEYSADQNGRFSIAPEDVKLDAPIRNAPKLIALAGNFRKHIVESGFAEVPENEVITPQVFLKPPSTTINASERVHFPQKAQSVSGLGS